MIVLVALLVCLIPTTIGALLSAIGIAGMDRLVQRNVLAMRGRAVEAAGDCSTLLLDKTGTITLGNRQAAEFLPLAGRRRARARRRRAARRASPTRRPRAARSSCSPRSATASASASSHGAELVPFTAQTRMSGVDLDGRSDPQGRGRLGPPLGRGAGRQRPGRARRRSSTAIAPHGGTPLVVAENGARARASSTSRTSSRRACASASTSCGAMGIRTVMITGDNPLTAKAIADEAGVDDFLAEATPEDKMALIKREQAGGRLVAMTGDGTNDAPALAQADVGVAMNTGTQAAKEAGNMVDLDSNPTKLIEIVEIGKQLLITRGALTTFSIANDVAKYFAIIPAMFAGVFPALDRLNIMRPRQPASRRSSRGHLQRARHRRADPARAARRAVPRRLGAPPMLRRNLLIYGARRADRPVHRHQADRPRRRRAGGRLMRRQLASRARRLSSRFTVARRASLYPLVGHGHRAGRVPGARRTARWSSATAGSSARG